MEWEKSSAFSVIIPALNEEENLEPCVGEVIQTIPSSLSYEILIINDGSSDRTGAVAEALKKEFPAVRVFHHPSPMGLGYTYADGVKASRGEFVMMVPGDNETRFASLKPALEKLGSHDIFVVYTTNSQVRPLMRRILSKTFTHLLNFIFGLKLKYYNGPCIHRAELLKRIPLESSGFAYMAQILIRLIKSGATYTQVPMELRPRAYGSSKVFSPRNIVSVLCTFLSLIWEVYFQKKNYKLRS